MHHIKISQQQHYNKQWTTFIKSLDVCCQPFDTMNEQVAKAVAFLLQNPNALVTEFSEQRQSGGRYWQMDRLLPLSRIGQLRRMQPWQSLRPSMKDERDPLWSHERSAQAQAACNRFCHVCQGKAIHS